MTIGFSNRDKREEEVEELIRNDLCMVGSDGIETPKEYGSLHPRTYGAFARVISKYVREGVMSLPEAICKITSFPARRFGLEDRGTISKGKKADLFVFDLENFADRATLDNPRSSPKGVKWVIVNGQVSVKDGEITGLGYGRVLKRKPQESLSSQIRSCKIRKT
jgi:N-acyl-D-amino-acid deacylase